MFNMRMDLPRDSSVVVVHTTDNRGLSTEDLASMCTDKLIFVSDSAPPEIREQARAFKLRIAAVIEDYLRRAVQNDRVAIYNALVEAGHPALAQSIRSL